MVESFPILEPLRNHPQTFSSTNENKLASGFPMNLTPFLRKVFLALPLSMSARLRIIDCVYEVAGPLFDKVPHYHAWLRSRQSRGVKSIELPIARDETLLPRLRELRFDEVEAPKVSILIPTYGNLPLTLACIASIFQAGSTVSYEVVVSEDASSDAEIDHLATVPGLRYIRQSKNQGFVGNCNAAADAARGEYLVFLNNDTQVLGGWLDALLRTFKDFPLCGMAGAMLIYPDGRLQEAGGIVWDDASAWNYGRFDDPTLPEYKYVRETDYCSGAALMISRALFVSLGGFSAEFAPAYYEDSDLAFKVRDAGLKVMYQPTARVIHFEGVSNGTELNSGLKRYQVVNAERFRNKWAKVLKKQHFPNGTMVPMARERSRHAKVVLIIDQYVPRPDRDAGSRSVHHVIDTLLMAGYRVKFWPHNLWYDPGYTDALQAQGVEVIYGKEYGSRFVSWIRAQSHNLVAVVLNRPLIAKHYLRDIRQNSKARIIYYGHDLHSARMQKENELTPGSYGSTDISRMRALEESLWVQSDAVLYPSDEEVLEVRKKCADHLVLQLPLYCFDQFPPARICAPKRRNLVFVAGFRHPPNIDGACWLVEKIMPLVWAKNPDAVLRVVGSAPDEKVWALKQERVEIYPDVSDAELAERYAQADVAVVPLRFGAGVKGKVVEALRDGLPLVTTSVGAQGLHGVRDYIAVADEPEGFAQEICQLLESDVGWSTMQGNMRAYAMSAFTREAMRQVLEKCLNT